MSGERIVTIAGAAVALLLQVFLAPHVSIGFASLNVLAVWCMVIAVFRSASAGPVLPFVLGLLYDLVSGGPVGAAAFALTMSSSLASWLFRRVNNDTVFMAAVVLATGLFLNELAVGLFYLLFGYASGVLEAFVYRVLPCFVYEYLVALAVYLLVARFMSTDAPLTSEIRQLH